MPGIGYAVMMPSGAVGSASAPGSGLGRPAGARRATPL